jgi:hypothetical protein
MAQSVAKIQRVNRTRKNSQAQRTLQQKDKTAKKTKNTQSPSENQNHATKHKRKQGNCRHYIIDQEGHFQTQI